MEHRTIVFKAIEWQLGDYINDNECFYVTGITQNNESVLIRVDGFTPFIYLELPNRIKWDKDKQSQLFQFIKDNITTNYKKTVNCEAIKYEMQQRYSLYYKTAGLFMFVSFNNADACRMCQYKFQRDIMIPGIGKLKANEIKVHEQNVDPIIKLTAVRRLLLGSWIEANEYFPEDVEPQVPFTKADIDAYVNFKDLKPITMPDHIQPLAKIVSWDIESYSHNHDAKLPNPLDIKNYVSQISVICCRNQDPIEKWDKYLLTIKKGVDITVNDTKVYHFNTEKELLLGFTKIINKLNPDILIGYNILKFDWNYLIKRADLLGIYNNFVDLGRIYGIKAKKITKDWESSAYGKQEFEYLECQGRLIIDILPEIERNWKFDSYSLDSVSEHFLKENKKPVSAKQMFKLTKFADLTQNYHNYKMTDQFLSEIKDIADCVFDKHDESGLTLKFYNYIQSANKNNIKKRVSKAMAIIGDYCVWDSVLPLKLFFKLSLLYNLEQMSNIFCVPISYLQTRGQQVKVLAQVYRYTFYHDLIVPFKKYNDMNVDEKYQGATVIDAVPDYWENITTLDFASLYPSIMIANNIDHTTFVHVDNKEVHDYECNIIEWEDHRGCSHDTKKIAKKEDILCGNNRYRFLKVIEKNGIKKNEGVFPYLLRTLLAERKAVKLQIKELNKQPQTKDTKIILQVLDAKQLAIKVSANSMYGTLGAKTGPMPLIPGAASVTAKGREYIRKAIEHIKNNFSAKLVYGDTDSCMVQFPKADSKQCFEIGKKAAKDATSLFPSPVELEFECVYGKFLLLTKKRYIAYSVNEHGDTIDQIKKGVVLKRRDNTHFLKKVYGEVITGIMAKKNEQDIFHIIYDNITKLFTCQVNAKDLIISKSIKNIMSYAKTKEYTDDKGTKLKCFIDHDKNFILNDKGQPIHITDPLDNRLLYDNTSHIMLALKMIKRGDEVPANTRLQYIFLDIGDKNALQGDRVEDYTFYKENKSIMKFKLDPLYYLEKQLTKPLAEIIGVLYRKIWIEYKSCDTKINEIKKIICKNDEILQIINKLEKYITNIKRSKSEDIYTRYQKSLNEKNPIYSLYKMEINKYVGELCEIKEKHLLDQIIGLFYTKKSIKIIDRIYDKFGIKKKKIIKTKKLNNIDMYIKDGNIMNDILRYRQTYDNVIYHLKSLFIGIFEE